MTDREFRRATCTPVKIGIWLKLALVGAGGVALAVACSRTPGASQPSRGSLLESTLGQGQFPSPAVWRYHPRSEAPLLARYELRDGKILFAGERGERWLFDKKHGGVRAAARLAPESLIAILHLDDGGWLFVGASGAGYEAREPLGTFVRTSAPLDKLARVSAAGTAVVGVTREGQLVRSADAGASWTPVGAKDVRYVDVALADQNRGLALSVPEAAWETKDGGASWKKLDVPSTSAFALAWDDQAGVAVQTALAWLKWDPGGASPFSPLGRIPARSRYKLPAKPERGPDALALAEGRAAVIGDEYVEVGHDDGTATSPSSTSAWGGSSSFSSRDKWTIWRGTIGGRLVAKPLDLGTACQALRIAGYDRYFYAACARTVSGANHVIAFYKSDDGGKHFEQESYTTEGRLSELELAVGERGELVVTGICAPHNTSRGCSPYGVYYRRRAPEDAGAEGGKHASNKQKPDGAVLIANGKVGKDGGTEPEYELAPAATPALKGSALSLVFSPDGRTVFAVGRRTKGTSLAVFVSHDRGESFEAREIEQIEAGFDEPKPDDRWARPPPTPTMNVSSVGAGEDGTLAIVVKSSGPPTLVVVDEEGRVVSFARAPTDATSMGAVGTRAIAYSDTTRMAWESLDAGATWDPVGRLPVATCVGASDCDLRVRCYVRGCVFGSELSRVGWHGQADDDQGVLAPLDTSTGDLYDRKARTPIACTLDEKPWQTLENVATPPSVDDAAIGKIAWYALAQDEKKAQVTIYHATGGNKPKVESVPLFTPVKKPTEFAYAASNQSEGTVAMRYPTPESGTVSLKNVEIAWDNLLEGKVVKAKIADAGPTGPSDYQRVGAFAQHAQSDLLEISTGGVYVRIHYSQRDLQPTLFVDGKSTSTISEVVWPSSSSPLGNRSHMLHVGAAHVPISLIGTGAAVVRGKKSGSSWSFDSFATGLSEPTRFGLVQIQDFAYVKGIPGLQVMAYDPDGTRRFNWLYPIRADGNVADAPIALPTQLDTGDKPPRCGSATRADSPRVIVPYQGGSRHPVIVTDSTEPMRVLLTGRAVMHGTPQEACVAAFDAEIVPIDPSIGTPEQEHAIIVMDDLEHSWIFRTSYGTMGESKIEYRVINCHFDPAAEIPPEIYTQPGTKLRRVK